MCLDEVLHFVDWENFLYSDFSNRENDTPEEKDLYNEIADAYESTDKWDTLAFEVEFKKPLETEIQCFG